MKTHYTLLFFFAVALTCTAQGQSRNTKTQRPVAATSTVMTAADHQFVQGAINSNNEALAMAQMALQQSKSENVRRIAGQLLNDHKAAQKRLYVIAHLRDSIPYTFYSGTMPDAYKLPLTDNISSRRNRSVATISATGSGTNTAAPGNSNLAASGTVAGASATNATTATTNNQGTNNPYTGTSNAVINQTYNGNTSIDNAVGVNNSNRTDIGGYSGRYTENTIVVNNQPLTPGAQPAVNPVTSPAALPNGTVASQPNTVDNVPNFPNRVRDTVRMTGSSDGFQNGGTNLSFPGNERYSQTTPPTRPNNNAGSDYGYTGVAVNNAPKDALNTAAYSNNEINGNIVQTGQLQGTHNPTAVINSSTTSMNNTGVALNNSNANRAAERGGVKARPNGTVVMNKQQNGATGSTGQNNTTVTPVIAGRMGNNSTAAEPAIAGTLAGSANRFYTNTYATTNGLDSLRGSTPQTFDKTWAMQMLTNQQAAITRYEATLKTTHHTSIRNYINTVLPLLRGHQYALQQWLAQPQ